jgi:hypothetical protein
MILFILVIFLPCSLSFYRDLNNVPFTFPSQSTTEDRYERFALKMVCMSIRHCLDPSPCIPILFSPQQKRLALQVLDAVDEEDEIFWPLLQKFLSSLFFSQPKGLLKRGLEDPITIFVILIHLNRHDGSFPKCSTIATSLSSIIKLMRVLALIEIHVQAESANLEEDDDDGLMK